MHIANIKIGDSWENLEELVSSKLSNTFTFDPSKNYYLVNCGGFSCLFINQQDKPDTMVSDGLPLEPKEQCGLKLTTGKVYARCLSGITNIHVEVEE